MCGNLYYHGISTANQLVCKNNGCVVIVHFTYIFMSVSPDLVHEGYISDGHESKPAMCILAIIEESKKKIQ